MRRNRLAFIVYGDFYRGMMSRTLLHKIPFVTDGVIVFINPPACSAEQRAHWKQMEQKKQFETTWNKWNRWNK
ncbi:hypothetical protein [Mucilaginibacter xinganensis]|nr:hypothetical protein [Mucilaginibacter xinganensis]